MPSDKWIKPTEGINTGLKLFNSITGVEEEFIPKNDNNVGWYICGPTVYDSSHLGHARNYVVFDILRRIMTDYFGYNVFFVMNITDIDDKIIIRAHSRRLTEVLKLYENLISSNEGFSSAVNAEIKELLEKGNELIETDCKDINKLLKIHAQLTTHGSEILSKISPGEVFPDWSIQEGYLALAKIYENEFLEDMAALGVRPPDALTRVSEYIPEIISYIQKIIDNNFAYEASGNVYFDIKQFKESGFEYGKTSNLGEKDQSDLLQEGEGLLSVAEGKRSPSDFALWKKSKPGEPQWDSPWGTGRPGWHIECSAMCSDLLGESVDINCGGVDLKFPHHDNQLAQSEAHFGCKQWVNYFLHSGHLHIDKLKMSKSLKNFISIRESLRVYSSRHIRFFFLLHRYSSNLEIEMVGGGPPKFGGKTGVLTILSSKIGNLDVTNQIKALVVEANNITLLAGTNLPQLFNVDAASFAGRQLLEISYEMDGVKKLSGWEVLNCELIEDIQLKAGGKIMQFDEAINTEKIFVDFFLNMKVLFRKLPSISHTPQKWNQADRQLYKSFQNVKNEVHKSLCNSLNTPEVITSLLGLVNETNNYSKDFSLELKRPILLDISNYVSRIMKVFGVIFDDDFGHNWSESRSSKIEKPVNEVLDVLSGFRDNIRSSARNKNIGENIIKICDSVLIPPVVPHPSTPIIELLKNFVQSARNNANNAQLLLQLCDQIRDDELLKVGVRLEDGKTSSDWKLDDVESTLVERIKKREDNLSRLQIQAEKEAKKRAEEEKKRLQEQINRIPPNELFKTPEYAGQFSQFDDDGIPTHDMEGKALSKSLRKKLETNYKKHVTKYQQQLKADAQKK